MTKPYTYVYITDIISYMFGPPKKQLTYVTNFISNSGTKPVVMFDKRGLQCSFSSPVLSMQ